MDKTIQPGDRLVVATYYYQSHLPPRKDAIVFKTSQTFLVSASSQLGGDTISGKDRDVIVNGHVIREPYVIHGSLFQADLKALGEVLMNTFGPVTVPDGKYFVMGDNRDVSLDSRSEDVGLSDQGEIVGKHCSFMVPTDRERAFIDRE